MLLRAAPGGVVQFFERGFLDQRRLTAAYAAFVAYYAACERIDLFMDALARAIYALQRHSPVAEGRRGVGLRTSVSPSSAAARMDDRGRMGGGADMCSALRVMEDDRELSRCSINGPSDWT